MNVGTKLTAQGAFNHLHTLDLVVTNFMERFGYVENDFQSHSHHDPVLPYTIEAKSLKQAIERAVANRRPDGKMFSLGSCVRNSSKDEWAKALTTPNMIMMIGTASSFEMVFDPVREKKPWGIGETSAYMTAVRIAAYLNIHQKDFLYLHAGPLKGWKALTKTKGSPYRVPWSEVPAPLRRLSPPRVEDLLCEYRDYLNPGLIP
jgi:hypothetical protein